MLIPCNPSKPANKAMNPGGVIKAELAIGLLGQKSRKSSGSVLLW